MLNGTEKTGGLGLSTPGSKLYSRTEATSLTGQTTAANAIDGYFLAGTNIQPYETSYNWDSALTTSSNYEDSTTALVYTTMLNKTYWVASRCIGGNSNACGFCVHMVIDGSLHSNMMFYSNSYGASNYGGSCSLFPIVFLDVALISPDGSNFKVDL